MNVDPGFEFIEKCRGGVQCYMPETKDFFSRININLKTQNNELVSFTGQCFTFRLSIREA